MIISLCGDAGSGKSTIAKKLAEHLGWPNYYIGEIRRLKAKSLGMTLAEYNKIGEKNPNTDLEVDRFQEKLGKEQDNFIIQGRTSWHFIPSSIKIYLQVDERVGAERILNDLKINNQRNEDGKLETVEDVLASQKRRVDSDKLRYQQYYGIDAYDRKNFDLVIDTTNLTEEEVFDRLCQYLKQYLPLHSSLNCK